MSKVQKVVKVITGQYVNAQGQQKNRYMKIGSIIETKNGPMLKLDANPFVKGGWDGWAYLNDPDPVEGEKPSQRASFDDMDDDIPGF
jgi:hypothetical protein